MSRPTQGTGGPDGRPRCFNAESMREYRANAGYDLAGSLRTQTIPWAFSQECKSWASHPATPPVPLAEGWKCEGCIHFPHAAVQAAVYNCLTRDP